MRSTVAVLAVAELGRWRQHTRMSNHTKRLFVGCVGLALAAGGALIRLYIRDRWFQEPLCLLISMGRTKFPTQAPYSEAVDAVSTMSMGIFYTGLVLIVASLVHWLFLPAGHDSDGKTVT